MSEMKQWTVCWYENVGYSVSGHEAFPNHSLVVLLDDYLAEKNRADRLEKIAQDFLVECAKPNEEFDSDILNKFEDRFTISLEGK
jgi:hypothetical protein